MAEGNATIAALRAAGDAAPAAPGGPVTLVYPWMTRQGSELVMPTRAAATVKPSGKSRTPPPATDVRVGKPFKSVAPPELRIGVRPGAPGGQLPRTSDGGRVTQDTPGFVDGVTLPKDVNPSWNFNPDLMDQLTPRNPDAPVYAMPPQDVVPAETKETPESAPPAVNSDLGLLEYIQPVPYAEPAPEYAQAAVPEAAPQTPESAPTPVSDFDLAQLLQFAQPPAPAAPVQPPAPQQQAVDVTLDPELLSMLGIPRRVRGGVMQ